MKNKFSIFNFKFSVDKKGFTLIELLIVIMIISILTTLLMTNFIAIRVRARDSQRKSNLKNIQSALEIYRADTGEYPQSSSIINCPEGTSTFFGNAPSCDTTYMSKVPNDPLGTLYDYNSNGITYCLRACLENDKDTEIDELNSQYSSINNPNVSGCILVDCAVNFKSFTLQNP